MKGLRIWGVGLKVGFKVWGLLQNTNRGIEPHNELLIGWQARTKYPDLVLGSNTTPKT